MKLINQNYLIPKELLISILELIEENTIIFCSDGEEKNDYEVIDLQRKLIHCIESQQRGKNENSYKTANS